MSSMSILGTTSSSVTGSSVTGLSLTGSTVTSTSTGSIMTQSDFLQLLSEQLKDQDPTQPMDNSQMASELAQFAQLSTSQDIDTNLQTLSSNISSGMSSSQVLSSANLVGKQVLVPSSTLSYSGSTVTGGVNVTTPGDVVLTITDSNGNVVNQVDMGTQSEGLSQFTWDGTDSSGNTVASGSYTVTASESGSSLTTYTSGEVTGVGYGGSSVGTYLQVAGVGGVPLSEVAQIN